MGNDESPDNRVATPLAEMTQRCRKAQREWALRPVRERLKPVAALRRLLVQECDRLCAAIASDVGKLTEEALAADVLPLAEACKFLQQQAERLLRPRRVSGRLRPIWLMGQSDTVHRRPRGLVGIIGTWNYPLYLNGVQILQALTAGNGVVWKPSEVAPATADAILDLLFRAGYPSDLVQKLPATREAGKDLAEADVDHVVFTGSSKVGRILAMTLAKRLVSSTLELSGCDAMFVLEDADPTFAAQAAWFGATVNRGQTCLAARRAFVQRAVYPKFLEALRPLVAAAAPMRLAQASQIADAERLVSAALADGGRLLVEPPASVPPETLFPRVVVDARPEMALCREASFAPVLGVLPFDTLDDALRLEGQCPYALGASVFTGNPDRVKTWAGRLRTGSVAINDLIVSTAHPATPFGGTGESGWGSTQGAEGLLEMTVPQVVSVRSGRYRPHFDLASGKVGSQEKLVRALLDFGHGDGLRQRFSGLVRMLRAMIRP
jgi:acyl-CoA reductase-like NAD-dependent aldehyde dehydrogenase